MRTGFRLGRLFGIEVNVDWSLLFIFAFITWNLASGFGAVHQDWSLALIWATALAAAILFFGSVLTHEFAHSLVARRQGVPVRSITLFLFGGVSNIQRQPRSPKEEFAITIVGPLTSFVLGAMFIALASIFSGNMANIVSQSEELLRDLGPVPTLLLWLGPINIVLGAFNLLPGFPLDGGRVVRSIFWAITENLRKATRWASYIGQGIAWLLIAGGFAMVFGAQIPLFGTGFINGLWLAFIGWFLHSAAAQSYQHVVIRDILEDVPIANMMRENTPTVTPDLNIEDLVHNFIMKSDEHSFPVIESETLVGLVSLEDVRSVPRELWNSKIVREIMTPRDELVVIDETVDAASAFERLRQRDLRQLPILSGSRMVGVLRRRDIIKWLQLHPEVMTT